MRKITYAQITEAVKNAYLDICVNIDDKTVEALDKCRECSFGAEKFALDVMVENAREAKKTQSPVCQDTGLAVIFAEVGQQIQIIDGLFEDAVNEGVREAYKGFRKSVLSPLTRINTGDNTPAIIHTQLVAGDKITLNCMAKGFGSENMGAVYMLTPADGIEGVKRVIVETVERAGGCPCPPVIVGVGIGGDMEKAAQMSKHAVLRDITAKNPNKFMADFEADVLNRINALNIGAGGFSGKVTALAVSSETFPTHIAGLPVGVTVQCHSNRHKTVII